MHVQPHLCTKCRRRCFIINKDKVAQDVHLVINPGLDTSLLQLFVAKVKQQGCSNK